MGQQLIGRPVSQRSSFATLTGSSSPNAPDQSQYAGFTTPVPQQQPIIPGGGSGSVGLGRQGYSQFMGGLPPYLRSPMFSGVANQMWGQYQGGAPTSLGFQSMPRLGAGSVGLTGRQYSG